MELENSIVYNAIVLTEASIHRLKAMFPPKHENEFYHHVTINFGKKEFPQNHGEELTFEIVGYAEDEKGQAAVVNAPSENEIPHITLTCADGVKPSYSNKLLQKGYKQLKGRLPLRGVVKSYTKRGWL